MASLSVVTRSFTRRSSRIVTSTIPEPPPAKSTWVTVPTSTPPTRTGEPDFRPFTSFMSALTW